MGRASWLFGVRVREYLHSYTLKSNSGYGTPMVSVVPVELNAA